jgi:flagellin
MALTVTNTNTIALLNILNRTAAGQSESLTRLSTGYRINRGKDDPAGLIALRQFDSELTGVNAAITNNQRTDAMLGTADSALGEVSNLLTEIQRLASASANSAGLSASEVAANQSQVDNALAAIDRIIGSTQFNGKKLLDNSLGITASGIDSADLTDVRVYSRNPEAESNSLTVRIDTAAERAAATGVITNSADVATTISVQGKLGTAIIEISADENLSSVVAKINDATATTGVVASGTTSIALRSQDYGSQDFVRVSVLEGGTSGGSDVYNEASDYGVDAGITINGQTAGTDGLTVNFSGNGLSASFNITEAFNSSAAGTTSTFTVDTTGGATFQIGSQAGDRATLGINGLHTHELGATAVGGFLSSLKGGFTNSLQNDPSAAAAIAAEAAEQVATLRGRLGGFQKFQVQTAINSLNANRESLESARSVIRDVDYASESAELNRQQVLLQSAIQLLGVANQQSSQVLNFLR